MKSVTVDGEVFAQLVASYPLDDLLLFKVSEHFVYDPGTDRWSEPVQLRFTRTEDAIVEMEVRAAVKLCGVRYGETCEICVDSCE